LTAEVIIVDDNLGDRTGRVRTTGRTTQVLPSDSLQRLRRASARRWRS